MAVGRRIVPMVAAAMFLLGVVTAIPFSGYAVARNTVVTGIVEYARGDVVTVAGKTHDLKGARFQNGRGAPVTHPSDLLGMTLEILFRNGKAETVTIYPTLHQ